MVWCSVDPSAVCQCLIRNGLSAKVAVRKPSLIAKEGKLGEKVKVC